MGRFEPFGRGEWKVVIWVVLNSAYTRLLVMKNPLVFIVEFVNVLCGAILFQGDRLSLNARKSLVLLDFEALRPGSSSSSGTHIAVVFVTLHA